MESLALAVTLLLFILGMAGNILPVLPGPPLIALGILIHRLWMGPESVSWTLVLVAIALAALAQLLDFALAWWGARRFGATWYGSLGALIGGVLGLIFFSLPGLILGPIIGAVGAELLQNRSMAVASRAGLGTVVGGLLAFVLKFALSIGLIVAFFADLPDAG